MLYGNGMNAEIVGKTESLDAAKVIATYNYLNFYGYYPNSSTETSILGVSYYKDRAISRNGVNMSIPAYQIQIGDVILGETGQQYNLSVTRIETMINPWEFDCNDEVEISRNDGPKETILAKNLLPNDFVYTLDDCIRILTVTTNIKTTPTLEILFSKSGFYTPSNAKDAIYVSRSVHYDSYTERTTYMPTCGAWSIPHSAYNYTTANYITMNDFAGPWSTSKPHGILYNCLNWWEFTNTPTDISEVPSAHLDKVNSEYGSYSNVDISAYTTTNEHFKVKRNDVEITEFVNGAGTNHFTVTKSKAMPSHMGGTILFSASDSFNENKFVGVGFNGLRHDSQPSNDDIAFKLYKFIPDEGHFKYIGNNWYIFNDDNIVSVKGVAKNKTSYTYGYSGPFFVNAGISAGVYTDSSQTTKSPSITISPSQYIKPYMFSSLSYLMEGYEDEVPTSGKPLDWMKSDNNPPGCHLKVWDETSNNTTYYTFIPFAPGILLGTNYNNIFNLKPNVEEFELGCTLSSIGGISKPDGNLVNLKKVNGSWKYCKNMTTFGFPGSSEIFYNASALETIPSSWEGMDNLTATSINGYFYNCCSLTAVPSSFNHYGNKTITEACGVFQNCSALKYGLKSWENLDNVTTAASMFYNCVSLESIPDSFEHLGNLEGCQAMFESCYSLKEIKSWNGINKIQNGDRMFTSCISLSAIPKTWDGINTRFYAPYIFEHCHSLTTIPSLAEWRKLFERIIPNGYVSSALNISYMFANCENLTGTIKEYLDLFIEYGVPGNGQFYGCIGFTDYEECHNSQTYAGYI